MAVGEAFEEELEVEVEVGSGGNGAAELLERREDGPLVWNERHMSADWASGPKCECALLDTAPDDVGLWRIAIARTRDAAGAESVDLGRETDDLERERTGGGMGRELFKCCTSVVQVLFKCSVA